MTVTVHATTATAYPPTGAPIVLKVLSSSLGADETWSPYLQGRLEIVTPSAADNERLDPRNLVRVQLTLSQAASPATTISANLVLRSRDMNRENKTTFLTVESDESLLQDMGLLAADPIDVGLEVGTSIRALSGYALAKIGASFTDGLTPVELFGKNYIPNPSVVTTEPLVIARNLHKNPAPFWTEDGWRPGPNVTINATTTLFTTPAEISNGMIRCIRSTTTAGVIVVAEGLTFEDDIWFRGLRKAYSVSAYVRVSTGTRTISMAVRSFADNGTTAFTDTTVSASVTSTAGWVLITTPLESYVGAKTFEVRFSATSGGVGESIVITGLNVTHTSAPTSYVDASPTYPVPGGWTRVIESEEVMVRDDGTGSIVGSQGVGVLMGLRPVGFEPSLTGPTSSSTPGADLYQITGTGSGAGNTVMRSLLRRDMNASLQPFQRAKVSMPAHGTFPAPGGDTVYAGVTVRINSGTARPLKITVLYLLENGSFVVSRSPEVLVTPGVWTRLTFANPVPVNVVSAEWMELGGRMDNPATAPLWAVGDWIDSDAWSISKTNETYFDGDTASTATYSYSWRGEAHNSISARNLLGSGEVDAASAVWTPGQSAYDFLEPLVQKAGRRLFADETRFWRIVDNTTYTVAGTVTLNEAVNVGTATDSISRSDEASFDAVVIEYRWTDKTGASRVAYDFASTVGYSKVERITYDDTEYPGPGAAALVLARSVERARLLALETVSRYDVRPNMAADVTLGPDFHRLGIISRVGWSTPDNRMSVSVRSLTT